MFAIILGAKEGYAQDAKSCVGTPIAPTDVACKVPIFTKYKSEPAPTYRFWLFKKATELIVLEPKFVASAIEPIKVEVGIAIVGSILNN